MDEAKDLNLALTEGLSALMLRVREQEIAIRYLLQMVSYLVNPDNPEHAYNHFAECQAAYVAHAPELSTMRSVVEMIKRAKGSES